MRQFGIIGYPLTHSFSEKYFTNKFQKEGIADASFASYSIEKVDTIQEIIQTNPNLQGFAITIPHKKIILSYLHGYTPEVEQMGASNCVTIRNGKLWGYNTDVVGFEQSFFK